MTATHGAPWSHGHGCGPAAHAARLAGLGATMVMAAARRAGDGGWGFGHGFGPWDFKMGRGPFGGQPPFWGRGPKAKRGDVRAAILALLAEGPRNGYQIIQEINKRSEGAWKPSPGAVYPALQQLADEGLIRGEEGDGRRVFSLTDAGRAYVAEHQDELRAPWESMTPDFHDDVHELFHLAGQAGAAIVQVAHAGGEGQVAQAQEVLKETRRKLYQILAEDVPGDEDTGEA